MSKKPAATDKAKEKAPAAPAATPAAPAAPEKK